MRFRRRHVLSGILLAFVVAAALLGVLHLESTSGAGGSHAAVSLSAERAPRHAFTVGDRTQTDHLAVVSRVVHAQPASRQLRLALALLVAGILFLARPRSRSRVGQLESSVPSWRSGFGPGRGPPAIRIA